MIILLGFVIPIAFIGYIVPSTNTLEDVEKQAVRPSEVWNVSVDYATILSASSGIVVDSNKNIYITYSDTTIASYIEKYNDSGHQLWKTFFAGRLLRIDIDESEEFLYAVGEQSNKVFLVKCAINGSKIWSINWTFVSELTWGNDLSIIGNNSIYITGWSLSTGDSILINFNSSGTYQWHTTDQFGSVTDSAGFGIKVFNNSIYVTGFKTISGKDYLVAKYDISGVRQWFKTWHNSGDDEARDVAIDPITEDVYITGFSDFGRDIRTIKYNKSGDYIWNVSHNTAADFDRGHCIIYKDGKIFVGGISGGIFGRYSTLLCYNKSGNLLWNYNYTNEELSGARYIFDMDFSLDRNLYIIGKNRSSTSVPYFTTYISKLKFLYKPVMFNHNVTPQYSTPNTNFTFNVNYMSPTNKSAVYVKLVFDGNNYTMYKNDSNDYNYLTGVLYNYTINITAAAVYDYYFITYDGLNVTRYPEESNITGPIVSTVPTLVVPIDTPTTALLDEEVVFRVVYADLDNDFPIEIKVWIENVGYNMTKENVSDDNYVDGVIYNFTISFNQIGLYEYFFNTTDGVSSNQTQIYSITINEPPRNFFWILLFIIPAAAIVVAIIIYWRIKGKKPGRIFRHKFNF
jgi:hypothetical protein